MSIVQRSEGTSMLRYHISEHLDLWMCLSDITTIILYIHTYSPWMHICVSWTQQDVEHVINTQIYKLRVQTTTNILQKQYYKPIHIKNSSTQWKQCVCRYFLKAALSFALSFWKFVWQHQMYFFENKIGWKLAYEGNAYFLYTVYRWICLKNFLLTDNEAH